MRGRVEEKARFFLCAHAWEVGDTSEAWVHGYESRGKTVVFASHATVRDRCHESA